MSVCRKCKATVKWIRMEDTGRAMPIDPQRDPAGTVAVTTVGSSRDLIGYVISRTRPLEDGYVLHRAHWDLCNRIGPADAPQTHQPTTLVDAGGGEVL